MTSIALLIPIALLLGLVGLGAFFWSLGNGQFDDMDGAALRILIDEDPIDDDLPPDDTKKRRSRPVSLPRQGGGVV